MSNIIDSIQVSGVTYDLQGGGGKAISAGTNISVTTGETADTVSCTIPAFFNNNELKGDIAIGTNLTGASYDYRNILIGRRIEIGNESTSNENIGIGFNTSSNSSSTFRNKIYGLRNVAIGANFEIGTSSYNRNDCCVVIGSGAKSTSSNAVVIGCNAVASGTTKTNINNQIKIDTSNQVYIYNKDNTEMICLQDSLGGGGGITSGEVQTMIDNSISGKTDESAFTAHTANTSIHVTTAQTAAWDAKSNFSGSYNDLTDKPTIPTVPTSNTAFTNDAGYITSNDITGKTDTTAFTAHTASTVHMSNTEKTNLDSLATNIAAISGITSTKVGNWDTASTNSHTHSNKTVLDGITSTKVSNWDGAVTALGGLTLWKGTQSAYDALSPNYDSNTIYFIKD